MEEEAGAGQMLREGGGADVDVEGGGRRRRNRKKKGRGGGRMDMRWSRGGAWGRCSGSLFWGGWGLQAEIWREAAAAALLPPALSRWRF